MASSPAIGLKREQALAHGPLSKFIPTHLSHVGLGSSGLAQSWDHGRRAMDAFHTVRAVYTVFTLAICLGSSAGFNQQYTAASNPNPQRWGGCEPEDRFKRAEVGRTTKASAIDQKWDAVWQTSGAVRQRKSQSSRVFSPHSSGVCGHHGGHPWAYD
jgi:hypothetical protein